MSPVKYQFLLSILSFPSPRLKSPDCPTSSLSWRNNNWIKTFPWVISAKWNANSLVQNLNLGHCVYFQWRYLLHQGRLYFYISKYSLFSVIRPTTPFPGLLHFTLDLYFIVLSVKHGGIKYHYVIMFGQKCSAKQIVVV